ncbi:MAG: class I SAM-dependent methyltransferase [Desulfobacteraceae bacterium]|nr:class I SAM-dependent methyltransferase [Desulfobacteraceae bacterium]
MNNKNGWQLLEDGPEAYEKYIVPAFSGEWAQDIVGRANLCSGDKILDIGCGTGIVSRCAYHSMGKSVSITGVDVNEIVLKKAREICSPDTIPIEWKQGHAEALPFPDAEFDVVLCQQGLQYFSDQTRALTEINRVLTSEGRVFFSIWRSLEYFPFYLALHKAIERYVGAKAALTLSSAFTLGDTIQLRELFELAGFKSIQICLEIKQMRYSPFSEFLIGGLAASPFGNAISKLKESIRKEMFQLIRESVSDYIDDHGLTAPMECYIVSAGR